MSVNGHDQSSLVKDEITPKRNAQRSVKGKVTKYGSDNEDDDEGIIQGMESDEVESDYMGSDSDTEKKIKKTLVKPKKVTKPKSGQIFTLSQAYSSFSLSRHQQQFALAGKEESEYSSSAAARIEDHRNELFRRLRRKNRQSKQQLHRKLKSRRSLQYVFACPSD